jgi:uncharacterized delta-60 repeat protein
MAFAATVFATQAKAGEGRLDRAFGDRGRVVVGNAAMAVGPEGSIALIMHRKRVVLLTQNGDRDSRFGRDGSVPVPARAAGWSFRSTNEALDSRGRMLIYGTAYPLNHRTIKVPPYLERVPISRAAVLRLLPDGRLDPSFGRGGAVVSNFGVRSEESAVENLGESTTGIAAGAVDSQDRPLFAVGAATGDSPCRAHSFIGWRPNAIVRLTPSGLLDPEFGEGDGLSPTFPEFDGTPLVSLALTSDDQPLMGGALSGGCPEGASVIRLSEEGTPLPGYGTEGRQNFRKLEFVAFAPDGGAILERRRFTTEIVRRVTPQGRPDPSFGHDGTITLKIPPGADPYQSAAVDSEGRILIVRSYARPAARPRAKRVFIVVERLLPSGRPDPSFGRGGRITVSVPGAQAVGLPQGLLGRRGPPSRPQRSKESRPDRHGRSYSIPARLSA